MKKFLKIIGVIGIIVILILLFNSVFYGMIINITDPSRTGEYYSKNNFNVFYEVKAFRGDDSKYDKKQIIVGADPKTFEVLNRYYTKDKNNFYICAWNGPDAFRIKTKCETIENVDRESFKVIDDIYSHYAKDKNRVYYFGRGIKNSDSQSFKIFNSSYTVDKNGEILERGDAKTFYTDNDYAIDEKHIYYVNNFYNLYIVKEIEKDSDIARFFSEDRIKTEEQIKISE